MSFKVSSIASFTNETIQSLIKSVISTDLKKDKRLKTIDKLEHFIEVRFLNEILTQPIKVNYRLKTIDKILNR